MKKKHKKCNQYKQLGLILLIMLFIIISGIGCYSKPKTQFIDRTTGRPSEYLRVISADLKRSAEKDPSRITEARVTFTRFLSIVEATALIEKYDLAPIAMTYEFAGSRGNISLTTSAGELSSALATKQQEIYKELLRVMPGLRSLWQEALAHDDLKVLSIQVTAEIATLERIMANEIKSVRVVQEFPPTKDGETRILWPRLFFPEEEIP